MNETKSIFTEGEPIARIQPPMIQTMMTGVSHIESSHPRYRLHYTDGTTEEATIVGEAPTDFFAIVSKVQSLRANS